MKKNLLNDLTGSEWLHFTKSTEDINNIVKYNDLSDLQNLIIYLIQFFTKTDDCVSPYPNSTDIEKILGIINRQNQSTSSLNDFVIISDYFNCCSVEDLKQTADSVRDIVYNLLKPNKYLAVICSDRHINNEVFLAGFYIAGIFSSKFTLKGLKIIENYTSNINFNSDYENVLIFKKEY